MIKNQKIPNKLILGLNFFDFGFRVSFVSVRAASVVLRISINI
jgi:hypothetical protein